MCYTTWDRVNCFTKNHMRPRAKLQVPSRILLSCACEEVQTTAGLLGTETALTVRGEKSVLVCLRVTSSFRKISPENPGNNPHSKLHFSLHIKLHNGSWCSPTGWPFHSNFFPTTPPRKELLSCLILWNTARICTHLPFPAKWKPIKPVVFGTCPFWYAPATSQFIISNNFQC